MKNPTKPSSHAPGATPQRPFNPAAARSQHDPRQLKPTLPAAPPVYRPQPTPRVLQTKQAVPPPARGPAPPPYRPQPGVLQPKFAAVNRPPAGPSHARTAAPPVYRPALKNATAAGSVQRTTSRPQAPPQAAPRVAPPHARPGPPTAGHARVIQAKYDVIIEPELPENVQKDLVIKKMTITDRPAYPDNIQGVFEFGKNPEKGHTLGWDVLKMHHEHKYKNMTLAQAASDLNSAKKKDVTGGDVKATVESVSAALKKWIEHKHKQEVLYWDSSGENTPRGSFFRGMKDEYLSYKNKPDDESKDMKRLYQELMVLAAVDFQESDNGGVKTARVDRAKRKLGRIFGEDFTWVGLTNWSGQVDDLKRYKEQQKRAIKLKHAK